MPWKPNTILRTCLMVLTIMALPTQGALPADAAPDVRAVVFYVPGAAQSRDFFAFYLPGLIDRWGSRLELSAVDVSRQPGAGVYRAAAKRWPLPPAADGTTVILVGDQAIVGLPEIGKRVGDDFDALAQDPRAADWPAVPGLDALLPEGLREVAARAAGASGASAIATSPAADAAASRQRIANGLAIAVLVGMLAATVHALTRLRRGKSERSRSRTAWLLPPALLAGLFISAYTGYTALAHTPLVCGPIGSCMEVQASSYAKFFGVPLGVLGVFGYLLIFVAWLLARRRSPQGGGWYWAAWAIALVGVLFSLRLTALEPFVIGATCLWCLGSAICMTLVFWLLSGFVRDGDWHGSRSSQPVT
jgi:uncharacterized membrane protein